MTQMNFNELIEKAKQDLLSTEKSRKRKFAQISGSVFKELFTIKLNHQMRLRRKQNDFEFDENNEKLINQLFYYLTGNAKEFKVVDPETNKEVLGELEKGLLVVGNLGSGKTMIMQAFCSLWDDLFRIKTKSVSAKKYVEMLMIASKSKEASSSMPNFGIGTVFIDDIAKESKQVNLFGTEVCPMADLLADRYNNGVITFMTGNYTLESLETHYDKTIADRMKEMFNIVILKGKSRRK